MKQKIGEVHSGIHVPIYQDVLLYQRNPEEPYRLVLLTGQKHYLKKNVRTIIALKYASEQVSDSVMWFNVIAFVFRVLYYE